MWKNYSLELEIDRLVGGIPRHPEIVRRWQEARWPAESKLGPDDPATSDEAAEVTIENLAGQILEEQQGIWTGFVEVPNGGGLAIEARQVKAMLKESANILRTMIKVHGKTIPLRARLAERVFVKPDFIPLGVTTPTETVERPIHVMTAQGPRTALKRTDICRDVKVMCELQVLDDGVISEATLRTILDHASRNGIGTDRSMGAGQFTFTLSPVGG